MLKLTHSILLLAACLLTGCAGVSFHPGKTGTDLPNTDVKTGIKYYNAKPFLLVSYTGNKDAPVKVDVVSLPDIANPVYAIYHSGLGSHQFTVTVGANGTLTTYGQTADTKIPETLTAIGNMASSLATGLKTAGIVKQAGTEEAALSAVKEALAAVQTITVDKNVAHVKPVGIVLAIQKSLQDIRVAMEGGNFDQKKALDAVSRAIDAAMVPTPQGDAVAVNNALKNAQNQVKKASEALPAAGTAPKPDFKLFEITTENNVIKLKEVDIAKKEP